MSPNPPEKRPGRPAGAPNRAYPQVQDRPARCPKCQSTDRTILPNARRVEWPSGIDPHTGQPVTHVIRRRARCSSCGQHYMVASYEYQNAPRKRGRRKR